MSRRLALIAAGAAVAVSGLAVALVVPGGDEAGPDPSVTVPPSGVPSVLQIDPVDDPTEALRILQQHRAAAAAAGAPFSDGELAQAMWQLTSGATAAYSLAGTPAGDLFAYSGELCLRVDRDGASATCEEGKLTAQEADAWLVDLAGLVAEASTELAVGDRIVESLEALPVVVHRGVEVWVDPPQERVWIDAPGRFCRQLDLAEGLDSDPFECTLEPGASGPVSPHTDPSSPGPGPGDGAGADPAKGTSVGPSEPDTGE